MANMIPISTVTVGSGGASSIVFSSIPQNYTDLIILLSGRESTGNNWFTMIFNGDTSSSYTEKDIYSTGTASGSRTYTSRANIYNDYLDASPNTANTFSSIQIYIPNYSSNTAYKPVSIDGTGENNTSSLTLAYQGMNASLWSNTSSITSITLTQNWAQYSSATLYGIRKY